MRTPQTPLPKNLKIILKRNPQPAYTGRYMAKINGQYFYKEIFIIKYCKNCRTRFEPDRYTWQNKRSICVQCVSKEIAVWRKANPTKWNAIVRRYRKKARKQQLPWVQREKERATQWAKDHPGERLEIARKSYKARSIAYENAVH